MPGLLAEAQSAPIGASVPDAEAPYDHVAVIYPKGQTPPMITVETLSDTVQTVLADGVAVAVVARADGPTLIPSDVLLIERVV